MAPYIYRTLVVLLALLPASAQNAGNPAGQRHAVRLLADGTVWTAPNAANAGLASYRQVPSLPAVQAIAAGSSFTLALDVAGDVWWWSGDPANGLPKRLTDTRRATWITVKADQPFAGNESESWPLAVPRAAHTPARAAVTLSAPAVFAPPTAGSGTFQITADQAWTATTTDPWLTVSPTSGTGTQTVTYSFGANPNTNARRATIAVSGKTLLVTQTSLSGTYNQWGIIGFDPSRPIAGRYNFPIGLGDGGPALLATFRAPTQLAIDGNGAIFFPTDPFNPASVRRIDGATGIISSITGAGGGGVAVDLSGNLFVSDTANHRINKVAAGTATITAIAGTGAAGFSGDGGPATAAQLSAPGAIILDAAGNLYFTDTSNKRIRRIDATSGNISTVAGTGVAGFSGDGGPAANAQLTSVLSMAFDTQGNLFLTDDLRIRKISAGTNIIATIAGNGTQGFSPDGVEAISSQFYQPTSVAVDAENNLYIADKNNCRVRLIYADNNTLGTVAGNGSPSGICPLSLATDAHGDVYVGDYYSNAVGRIFFLDRSTPATTLGSAGNSHPATAGSGSITVASGGAPWFATSSDSWLTLSAPGGTGSGSLNYTLTQNSSLTPRLAWIQIGNQRFRVRQSGAAVALTPNTLALAPAAAAGTVSLSITPALPWTAQSSDTWLTISPASGSSNQALTYTVTANPGTTARTASLLIAGKLLPVVQAAANGAYTPWGAVNTGTIRTIAGNGISAFSGDNGPATAAALNGPNGIAVNANSTVFFGDYTNSRLRKITPATGIITTASGNGTAAFSGDNGPATSAQVSGIFGAVADKQGNIYFADSFYNHRVRKIDAISGTITTVAGNGSGGFSGDGGAATAAALYYPGSVAVDAAGNLLIADTHNHRIRRIDAMTGIITTIAGTGAIGIAGDGGPAELAAFNIPLGIAVDGNDNIFISDTNNNRIRRIDATTGIITTVAGTGAPGLEGDSGQAVAAKLSSPCGITVDPNSNLYIADANNHRIRRVNLTTGIITTVAGTSIGFSGDGAAAIAAKLYLPYFVAVDNLGNLYITDRGNSRIRYVDFASPTITLTPGAQSVQIATQPPGAYWSATSSAPWLTLSAASGSGDATLNYTTTPNPGTTARFATITVNGASTVISQPAPAVTLSAPSALLAPAAASASFTLTISNNAAWTAASTDTWLTITTPSGNGSATVSYSITANTGTAARTATILVAGKLFTVTQSASNGANTPWGVTANGAITTIAGTGVAGSTGDGGAALLARTNTPAGIAIDTNGNVYFADTGNHRIRKITASTRVISTVAGSGAIGFSGDGGLAPFAQINAPSGVAVDPAGNLYIADTGNHRIRRVDAVTGVITTIAGTGISGFSGDGDLATTAQLNNPSAVAVDPAGNVFIADTNNNGIRRIDAATNLISTLDSDLNAPSGVSLDPAGNLYIADTNNGRIRKWTASTGITTTVAGREGNPGYNGDSGVATDISLYTPVSVAADAMGNFYIAEKLNNRIRKVTLNGTISTIVGNGNGAAISQPLGVAVDGNGSLYFSDSGNNRILFIDYTTPPTVPLAPTLAAATPSTSTAATTQTFTLTARDGNGYADIRRIYFLLSTGTTIAANSCHGYYDRVLNTTSLYNNDLTGFGTNSQCAITAAAAVSGNDLQYTLTITRQGAYANGSLTLSAWIVDSSGLGTGWVTASTWNTGAQQPPTLASATPATTTAATQAFTITARDANGAADINRIYFLLNSNTNIPANSCHGFYDRALNTTYLYNDALTGFGTNSQCAVTATATTTSATDIQYILTITRQGAYANGNLNLYTWITDNNNTGTGWLPIATWALGTQQPPVLASATPSAPTTATQTFTITARDPNGATDINRIYFLVNSNTNIPTNTCHGFYDRALNTTYLYNDALTGLGNNSQCAVTATATTSGTDVQLNLTITRQGAYANGSLNVYTWITDNAAAGTGWLPVATWNIGNQQAPTLVSATPATSTNLTQTFTITANDPNGATDINRIYFLVNPDTSIPTYTCHGYYDRALNTTYLYNDSLTGFGGNTQCTVSATAATVSANSIQLSLTITRSSAYSIGNLNVYTWITDSANTGTGWLPIATWNVGPQQPPALFSATPISTTTTTQTFTIVATDRNGATDLNRIYFLLDTSRNIPTNTCHGFYDRATNTVSVYNDTLTGLGTSSQCTVTGTATQTSSTDIQLNLTITRKGPYTTGAKTLYLWITDNQNVGTGWIPSVTWTL